MRNHVNVNSELAKCRYEKRICLCVLTIAISWLFPEEGGGVYRICHTSHVVAASSKLCNSNKCKQKDRLDSSHLHQRRTILLHFIASPLA